MTKKKYKENIPLKKCIKKKKYVQVQVNFTPYKKII